MKHFLFSFICLCVTTYSLNAQIYPGDRWAELPTNDLNSTEFLRELGAIARTPKMAENKEIHHKELPQVKGELTKTIDDFSDALTELVGSFCDNPYHHSNTLKLFEITKRFKKTIDELYSLGPAKLGNEYYRINNMRTIIRSLDYIIANIAGYSRGGYDAFEWESTFNKLLPAFGWTWEVIHSTTDIVFFEYRKDKFQMVLAKNIRPKKKDGDYNANSFTCYSWHPPYEEEYAIGGRIVFGGNYQFVEFGDDETEYKIISRVTSKRGTTF